MLRLALLLPLAGTMFLFQSCVTDPITCIRVSSSQITESRDIRDFKGIILYENANLIITQGSEYAVKMTGPQNVVELTNTTLANDYLVISSADCFNGNDELTIEVTAPVYELISVEERSTLITTGVIEGENIQLSVLGAVDIDVELVMDSVFTSFVGDGELNFSGSSIYHQITLEGEFEVGGFELITDHIVIGLIGTGDCEVYANEILDVSIMGIGNVYFKGNPDILSGITGTGEIINVN